MLRVVIPIYKSRPTICDLLDSLVAQTYKDFEVILSQDADGETYEDIIAEYSRRGLQIKLLSSETNGGPGVARQRGIDCCDIGDYVTCADADDIFNPRALKILYSEALKNDADMIVSDFIQEFTNVADVYHSCDSTPCTWMHGRIYKVKFLRDNNIRFLDELTRNEDAYFNVVITHTAKRIYKIKEATYVWKDNKNSLTRVGGADAFFKDTWDGFILSQVKGIRKIISINGTMDTTALAKTLCNLFEATMRAKYYGLDDTKANEYLHELREDDKFQELYKTTEFWNAVIQESKTGAKIGDVFVFYTVRMCDWLSENVLRK